MEVGNRRQAFGNRALYICLQRYMYVHTYLQVVLIFGNGLLKEILT
jgi:hypothetical protein